MRARLRRLWFLESGSRFDQKLLCTSDHRTIEPTTAQWVRCLETPHVGGGKQDPFIAKPNCASHMRCGRGIAAPGLWSGSGRFHAHGCKLRRALPGPWRPRVDRNLPQPDGILNLIGGSSSLEQSAPSPLQVAVSFNRILKGAGHECLLVSAGGRAGFNFRSPFQVMLCRPAWADAGLRRWPSVGRAAADPGSV